MATQILAALANLADVLTFALAVIAWRSTGSSSSLNSSSNASSDQQSGSSQ